MVRQATQDDGPAGEEMPMCLAAEVRPEPDGSLTLLLGGELDLAQAEDLTRLLSRTLRRSRCIRLDLADVTFMDCTVLGVLVRAGHRARAAGGWVRISTCHPGVRRLLRLTGLEETFELR
jgi:anti-sigma B factor antagonist